jgi:hypothetical protein
MTIKIRIVIKYNIVFGPKYSMDENYLLESVGEQKKRAAVVVGRFSTPHSGHYALINTVKKYIRDNKELKLSAIPIVVIIDGKETGKDKGKNPLTADERIMFMDGSGNANGVRFLKADTAFAAFEEVRKAGYEPIAVGGGSDRTENYLNLLDKYFVSADDKKIKHYSIQLARNNTDNDNALDDILEYMDNDIPVNMISGTLARHAVSNNEFNKFVILVGLSNNHKLAKLMFNKIKQRMTNGTT